MPCISSHALSSKICLCVLIAMPAPERLDPFFVDAAAVVVAETGRLATLTNSSSGTGSMSRIRRQSCASAWMARLRRTEQDGVAKRDAEDLDEVAAAMASSSSASSEDDVADDAGEADVLRAVRRARFGAVAAAAATADLGLRESGPSLLFQLDASPPFSPSDDFRRVRVGLFDFAGAKVLATSRADDPDAELLPSSLWRSIALARSLPFREAKWIGLEVDVSLEFDLTSLSASLPLATTESHIASSCATRFFLAGFAFALRVAAAVTDLATVLRGDDAGAELLSSSWRSTAFSVPLAFFGAPFVVFAGAVRPRSPSLSLTTTGFHMAWSCAMRCFLAGLGVPLLRVGIRSYF